MKIAPDLKRFLLRVIIFFALFIAISGIIGPWVIRTRLLYGFYFFIYGNLGKVLLIGFLAFFLLAKDKLQTITIKPYRKANLGFIAGSFLLLPVFFILGKYLLAYSALYNGSPLSNLLSALLHLILMLSVVLLALGVFSYDFLKSFFTTFKKEVAVCIIFAVFMYFMIFQVWKLWPFFSDIVLKLTSTLLSLTYINVAVFSPRTLQVNNFAVVIAQACSGLDSLFLFTCLYWFFGLVEWKALNKTKLILMFIPAAIGLFLVNILRIYLLMVIGASVNPDLALNLFHTYAGMILFILYFGIFMKLTYSWMKKP